MSHHLMRKMFRQSRSSMRKQTNGLFRSMPRAMIKTARKQMGFHATNRKSHQVNVNL